MQPSSHSQVSSNDLEIWTLDDAEAWREAERCPEFEGLEDDPVLDNDLWMDADLDGALSIRALGRLGIRVS